MDLPNCFTFTGVDVLLPTFEEETETATLLL